MNIKIIDPTADKRWDEFIIAQPESTIFHTSAWAKAILEAYHHQPCYFVLENQAGKFVAGMPCFRIQSWLTGKRLECLPFSDYCYPLSKDAKDIAGLLDLAKKEMEAQRASYLEIRGWPQGVPPVELAIVPNHYYLSYVIDLDADVERLKSKFHNNVKRCIRQAEKENMTFRLVNGEDGLKEFYRLNNLTRKKLGVLPQPYAFFRSIFRHLLSQGLGFIMLAEYNAKVIAAVLFLTHRDTIYYKFNASDSNYLRNRPNHLLIWESIKHASAQGYRHFDFGRCNPEEESLRTFKRRWAARELEQPYYYYPDITGITSYSQKDFKYKLMNLAVHAMPNYIFTAAGSILYKHLG